MDVDDLIRDGAKGADHEGANGDVGHETAVHHVDVYPVTSGFIDSLDLHTGRGIERQQRQLNPHGQGG